MTRFLPIVLGLAASALVLLLLMPNGCVERRHYFGNPAECPAVSSRIGLVYSNEAFGSWVANLGAALVGISVGVVAERKLDRRTEGEG